MKKLLSFFTLLLMAQFAWAQTPIDQARNTAVGQTVTITGTVTNGSEMGVIRYIQDATGGLPIYDNAFASAVGRGDSVTVTGEMDVFGGLLELKNVTHTFHAAGKIVLPKVVTPGGIGPVNEGELLKINNVTFSNAGGTFASGTLNFTDGSQTSQIYLNASSILVGTTIPQTAVNITGLSSQYNGSAQLLVRDLNDIEIASTFYLTNSVTQTNLTNSGFTLNWETNINGSSNIVYGTSATSMTNHVNGGSATSTHSVNLTGLNAGSIYYARAYSVNNTDTAWSTPGVYATVSNSTGEMKIYFNQVVNHFVSTGTNAQYLSGANIIQKLIDKIDNAQHTIDLAIYNFNQPSVIAALSNAHNRGVQVRVVADNGTANVSLQTGNIPFNWFVGNADGLMHNKFMIIDAQLEDDSWLFMGSMNLTAGEINNNYNSVIFIQDQSLARSYELEFNEMWGTNTATAGIFSRKLGANKENNTPHSFIINGIPMELYFSPSDGVTATITSKLQSADSKIEFALLTFTRDDLRDIIINKHNAGINIRGMIENINDTGGEFPILVAAGVPMRHHSEQYLLHHKYAIIDADMVNSDPMVIIGSHNWTSAAENGNDENTLVIHDATIANLYTQEFDARWIGLVTKNDNVLLGLEGFDIEILGNPVKESLIFEMKNDKYNDVAVQLYNISGQLLRTEKLYNIDGTTQHQLNISDFPAGNYIAVFQVDGVAIGRKFVK